MSIAGGAEIVAALQELFASMRLLLGPEAAVALRRFTGPAGWRPSNATGSIGTLVGIEVFEDEGPADSWALFVGDTLVAAGEL